MPLIFIFDEFSLGRSWGGREVRRREKLRDDDPRDAQTAGKRKRPCADLNRDCWIQGPECWPLHHKATGDSSGVSSHWPRQVTAAKLRRPIKLHTPGIEPGAQAWKACMLPLHYECHGMCLQRQGGRKHGRSIAKAMSVTTRYATPGQDRTGDLQRVGLTS